MNREMKSLEENNVWELTTLPPGKKAVGSKWVYKVITNSDGSIECYKTWLVAQGFNEKFGSEYNSAWLYDKNLWEVPLPCQLYED